MSEKQTAVKMLLETLHYDTDTPFAKYWLELEKQNLIDAFNEGYENIGNMVAMGEKYYNNTFNQ